VLARTFSAAASKAASASRVPAPARRAASSALNAAKATARRARSTSRARTGSTNHPTPTAIAAPSDRASRRIGSNCPAGSPKYP
jgi:hypothetical protein